MSGISNTTPAVGAPSSTTIFAEHFLLQETVTSGERFAVWRCLDQRNGEEVALKFFPRELINDPAEIAPLREILTPFRNLRDPRVIAAHQVVVGADRAAVVTPWIKGPTLAKLRQARSSQCFDVAEIETWIRALIDLLEAVHARGLFHGALGPDNIHVRPGTGLCVVGFGIYAWLNFASQAAFGPPKSDARAPFVSPALQRGDPPRATDDVFAFGALVYELLAGSPPRGPGRWLKRRPPSMAGHRRKDGRNGATIPDAWESVVQACLEHEVARRLPVFRKIRIGLGLKEYGPVAFTPDPIAPVESAPLDTAPALTQPSIERSSVSTPRVESRPAHPQPPEHVPSQSAPKTPSPAETAPAARTPAPALPVSEEPTSVAPASAAPRDATPPIVAAAVVTAEVARQSAPAPVPEVLPPAMPTKDIAPPAPLPAAKPAIEPAPAKMPSEKGDASPHRITPSPAEAAALADTPAPAAPMGEIPFPAALPITAARDVAPAIVAPELAQQGVVGSAPEELSPTEVPAESTTPPASSPAAKPPAPESAPTRLSSDDREKSPPLVTSSSTEAPPPAAPAAPATEPPPPDVPHDAAPRDPAVAIVPRAKTTTELALQSGPEPASRVEPPPTRAEIKTPPAFVPAIECAIEPTPAKVASGDGATAPHPAALTPAEAAPLAASAAVAAPESEPTTSAGSSSAARDIEAPIGVPTEEATAETVSQSVPAPALELSTPSVPAAPPAPLSTAHRPPPTEPAPAEVPSDDDNTSSPLVLPTATEAALPAASPAPPFVPAPMPELSLQSVTADNVASPAPLPAAEPSAIEPAPAPVPSKEATPRAGPPAPAAAVIRAPIPVVVPITAQSTDAPPPATPPERPAAPQADSPSAPKPKKPAVGAEKTMPPSPWPAAKPKPEPTPQAAPAITPLDDGNAPPQEPAPRSRALARTAPRPAAPPIETMPLLPPRPPIRYVPGEADIVVTQPVEVPETSSRGSRWGTYVLGVLLVCTVLMTIGVGGMLGWRMYDAHREFVDLQRQVLVFPLDATEAERAIFEARLTAARSRLNTQQWRTLREAWAAHKSGRPDHEITPAPPAQSNGR